ncbi:MAG: hypothetical protein CUN56_06355 [Phototrophicales bacterium]|nr:MAG: hypothetical protein CUN56_06355 [Phototrophicales bacterium]RMG70594.1 MAG: hypothetical protein D6711_16925 [Chloroflexota bacterium]
MELEIRLDNTGFPMVWMNSIGAYVQWLPITKIQIEYFLASTNDAIFDQVWYENILVSNARIAPTQIRPSNYWQIFTTNILPREAVRYANWCGRGYTLMMAAEWQQVYYEASNIPYDGSILQEVIKTKDIKERPKTLIERLARALPKAAGEFTLADVMLLRNGIMEYVFEDFDRNTFVGLGLTNPDFVGSFKRPEDPQVLNNPSEGRRMRNYGFRLMYRGN